MYVDRSLPVGAAIVMQGEMAIWQQEGGHASPVVQVGQHDVTQEIENLFQTQGEVPGKWRITVERIE